MKSLLLSLIILLTFENSSAQIAGTDSVCPGYIYNYSAVIVGADSISWTFPIDWQVLQNNGQQVQVFCNVNVGQVCATGYDSLGNSVGQTCKNVFWQGGGGSWHVDLVQHVVCQCYSATISVVPDNPSPACVCTGTPSINMHLAYYNNPWPTGQFQGYIDTPIGLNAPLGHSQTYYVYLIDVTFGIQNAVRVEGGACPGTIINSFNMPVCTYIYGNLTISPDPVCPGDTVTIRYTHNLEQYFSIDTIFSWQAFNGTGHGTLLPPTTGPDSVRMIVDSLGIVDVLMTVTSTNVNCIHNGGTTAHGIPCTFPPIASFSPQTKIEICSATSATNSIAYFFDSSSYASSYQWLFPGGSPSSSTLQNPPIIRYSTPGFYDVTLIVTNPLGNDTLTRQNFVTVNPTPMPVITITGDTLHAGPGFISYEWHINTNPWSSGTDSIFIAPYNGSYYVYAGDSTGCTGRSATVQFTLTNEDELNSDRILIYLDRENQTLSINDIRCNELSVFDIAGRKIKSVIGNQIGTSGFSNGVYILRCRMGNRFFYKKFLIE